MNYGLVARHDFDKRLGESALIALPTQISILNLRSVGSFTTIFLQTKKTYIDALSYYYALIYKISSFSSIVL